MFYRVMWKNDFCIITVAIAIQKNAINHFIDNNGNNNNNNNNNNKILILIIIILVIMTKL